MIDGMSSCATAMSACSSSWSMVADTLLPKPSIRSQERAAGTESYGHATLDVSTGSRDLGCHRPDQQQIHGSWSLAQYGLLGAAQAAAADASSGYLRAAISLTTVQTYCTNG